MRQGRTNTKSRGREIARIIAGGMRRLATGDVPGSRQTTNTKSQPRNSES